jgi:hypothetical protein
MAPRHGLGRKGEVSQNWASNPPEQVKNVDYTKPITNGPTSVGFDTYFGISASLDMVPYCFIENDHVVANPTETMKLAMNGSGGKMRLHPRRPRLPRFSWRGRAAFAHEACTSTIINEKAPKRRT